MATVRLDRRDRTVAALVAGAIVALLVWLLVLGLAIDARGVAGSALKVFGVDMPPPPPEKKPIPPHRVNYRPSGEAAPPNLRSRATEIVAPIPEILTPPPPPVVVAPVAFDGAQASQGAADVAGPGTGAGGQGTGTGSGRSGNGEGDGGTPLRRIGDDLRFRDLPGPIVRELLRTGVFHYVVHLRFTVGVAGRVTDCVVTRSSGNAGLDATTCRLAIDKLRYRPELDGAGRPIPVTVVGTQEWTVGRAPPGEQAGEDE